MKKAMLVGVGLGSGVECAIHSSMKHNNPDFVVFIATKESISTLNRPIESESGKMLREVIPEYDIVTLDNPENLNSNFDICEKAIRSLICERGFNTSEIVVDITSGTKIMSATISAAAILYRIYGVVYVGGKRDNRGIVIKGSEKPEIMKPDRILLRSDMERIKDYFQIRQYEASRNIVQTLLDKSWFILEDEENYRLRDVKEILEGFISWERFDHKSALAHFNQVKVLSVEQQKLYLNKVMTSRNRINARLVSLSATTEQSNDKERKEKISNIPTTDLVLEVFFNAQRRSVEGNYDDAVARLYRCLEMLEQHLLFMEHNLLTSDINLEKISDKIPLDYFQKLSKKKKNEKETIEVGLVEGFEIMVYLNEKHPVTKEYLIKKDLLKKCLRYRNFSILAHGTNPITKDDYELMEGVTKGFIKSIVIDVDSHANEIERLFDVRVLG
jgi:CRISPR-associated protein (TIGR02710 family)